jgi:nucleoside-diphosphate-sugar epimerase
VNVDGTKALLAASLAVGVQRVVHVSSVIVYGVVPPTGAEPIDETTSLPTHPYRWAHYQQSKSAADALALNYWREAGVPVTVLRLGVLYGPGGRDPARGLLQLGPLRFTLGNGRNTLPFTYVGNAVDCMLLAAITPAAVGQAYNVVDEPQVTARDVVDQTMQITGERCFPIPLPKFFLSGVAALFEWKSQLAGAETPPKLSRFVVKSACRNLYYDTAKARSQLGWKSAVTLSEGLRKTFDHNRSTSRSTA